VTLAPWFLEAAGRHTLDALYPERCSLCGTIGRPRICPDCMEEFEPHTPPVGPGRQSLEFTAAVYAFRGRAAHAVKRLKYERATSLAAPMAGLMRKAHASAGLPEADAIVPVPIHRSRERLRGFNQSELLVEELPGGLVNYSLLKRTRQTRPQVELTAKERLNNLRGAFEADPRARGLRVLLVDDVVTSGGTALACAEALIGIGAASVGILAFCGEKTSVE